MIELIDSPRVRSYELTYLVPVTLTTTEVAAAHEAVKSLVTKVKGTVLAEEDWGKKEMAYDIRHAGKEQREVHYKHLIIEMPAESVQTVERELGLQTNIMRHLLVLADASTSSKEPEENATEK
jgi:small subunit ribosomal protein S6